ncbi:MAG: enoyl-[acyl-carrier-protein] reductase FabK [Erysipelotrichaceae bacterium]|nr:enoyl-[acyl-carrier-protein] reductase FabK [Erysipelotrichaceae bacterium]
MLLNEMLNIKYPIIGGAMANIGTAEFAAAVSNAGGLGIIATGAWDAEKTRSEIIKCKSLTDKPFGVNIMLMNPHAKNIVDVIIEQKPAVVTTGAGNPGSYVEGLKAAGIKVFPVVAAVALAKRLERYGVDGFIVEGTESGGHVGEATTMALVPQVIEAVNVPVIAAGGIATGKQLNAALALGAIGIQVGTCLLVSDECPIHENYKDAVIKARDSDTVVTGRSLGAPVRIYKNKMTKEYLAMEARNATRDELEQLTLGALRRAVFDGDVDNGSVMMGQVAGIVTKKASVKEILETLVNDAKKEKDELISKINSL